MQQRGDLAVAAGHAAGGQCKAAVSSLAGLPAAIALCFIAMQTPGPGLTAETLGHEPADCSGRWAAVQVQPFADSG